MKMKLLVAAAATVLASSAMAQSAFEGFYGQIATGYESNQVGSGSGTKTESNPANGTTDSISSPSQSFGGAPIVLGLGYNFSVAPQWLLGVGVDYSLLSQTSSSFSSTITGGDVPAGTTFNGSTVKAANRLNIFVTPGYAIDKDKLVYLKAGYSSVQATFNPGNTITVPGFGTFTNAEAGQNTASSQSKTVGGYIIGLGYKQMITNGLYAFGEANYMGYSKPSFSSTRSYTDGTGTFTSNTSASLSAYQLLVGVGYKF
jgi:opacity protein-like surface antigen